VYIATRSSDKSQGAIEELKKETGNESVFFLKLDLSDLVSVKASAEEFIRAESELHTLYNIAYVSCPFSLTNCALNPNASGVYSPSVPVTKQGFDMQFGTNVLGTKRGSAQTKSSVCSVYQQATSISPSYSFPFSRRLPASLLLEL
jgi:retinol dehydrogenase 12